MCFGKRALFSKIRQFRKEAWLIKNRSSIMAGYDNSFPTSVTFCVVFFSMATCFYFELLTCQRSKAYRIKRLSFFLFPPAPPKAAARWKKNKVPWVSDLPLLSRFIIISSRCAGYLPPCRIIGLLLLKTRSWAACQLPVQLALTPNPDLIIEGNSFSRGITASH